MRDRACSGRLMPAYWLRRLPIWRLEGVRRAMGSIPNFPAVNPDGVDPVPHFPAVNPSVAPAPQNPPAGSLQISRGDGTFDHLVLGPEFVVNDGTLSLRPATAAPMVETAPAPAPAPAPVPVMDALPPTPAASKSLAAKILKVVSLNRGSSR